MDEAGAGPAGTATSDASTQGSEPGGGTQASWMFPDAPAADLPRTSRTAELPDDNDAAVAALHALFEDASAGAALPVLLTRISGEGIELAEADKTLLARYWRSAPNWKGANQLSYLASRLLRDVEVKDARPATSAATCVRAVSGSNTEARSASCTSSCASHCATSPTTSRTVRTCTASTRS